MQFSEISGLSAKELIKKKKELQAEMFDARMKNTLGQLPNQMVICGARKDIARINTALTALVKKEATSAPKARAAKPATKKAVAGTAKKTAAKKTSTRGKKG